jgi:hypothetical protein
MLRAVDRPDEFERVRHVLARQRRQGASFESAWQIALAAIDRSTDGRLDAESPTFTLATYVPLLDGDIGEPVTVTRPADDPQPIIFYDEATS